MKPRPIRERIRDAEAGFTPAERRIARVLTAGYPTAGLATVAELARQAEASGATILRFMTKLGFTGFPVFQEALRGELTESLQSPLARFEATATGGQGDRGGYAGWASLLMKQAAEMIPEAELEDVVELLADEKRPVALVGGRFSRSIAALFSYGLGGLRGRVTLLSSEPQDMVRAVLDMGRRDVVVVFDFRRYQDEIIRFAESVAAAGATLVVVTDTWRSPAASHARHVFALPVASPSIYDSALAPVMCVEAIVARLAERMGPKAAARIAEADRLYARLS
jgi:DNA-binding MurR/RpiR family transcriptional regulator